MQKCFDKTNFKQLKSFVDKWCPNRPSSNQKPTGKSVQQRQDAPSGN
jgi:hypothetical protein